MRLGMTMLAPEASAEKVRPIKPPTWNIGVSFRQTSSRVFRWKS
jgi:hypothetical protein